MNADLKLHGSSNRFDGARKLSQETVPGVLHNAAAVFRNRRLNSIREECPQFGVGSFFVVVHKPRIASHVGGQYRRQPTFDPEWPLLHHGMQSNQRIQYDG